MRGRWAWFVLRVSCASMLAWVLVGRAGATEPRTAITCDLADSKGTHYDYSFLFEPDKGTLFWVQGREELRTERHTAGELLVSRRGKFGETSAQVAYLELALGGGGATMTYFRDPTAGEIAKCEGEQSPADCKAPVALPQYYEAGTCTFEQQAAK